MALFFCHFTKHHKLLTVVIKKLKLKVESVGSPEILTWVILQILIFFARICDMSLGTIRVLFISKEIRN